MTGTTSESPTEEQPDEHLADLEDGCGCAEVWEHLSDRREARSKGADAAAEPTEAPEVAESPGEE